MYGLLKVWSFPILLEWIHCCFHGRKGGKGRSSHGGNSYSGTSSLLPAGGHWIPFVVAMVQDSQQQALICSWLEFDHDNFRNGWPEKSAAIAIPAGGWLHGEFVILNFGEPQQRFTALGNKPFKTKHLMRINLPGWGWGWLGFDHAFHMQSSIGVCSK